MSILPNQSSVNLTSKYWADREDDSGLILSSLEAQDSGLSAVNVPITQGTTLVYQESFIAPSKGRYVAIATISVANFSNLSETFSLSITDTERSPITTQMITFQNQTGVNESRTITCMFSGTPDAGDNVSIWVRFISTLVSASITYSNPTLQIIFTPTP